MAAPAVIAVFGPTGVGKTAVAIALADRLRGRAERPVAVSADALQVYAGLEILTGAPTLAERERLEHRLVSFVPIEARFSVGEYAELAHAEIDRLLAAGQRPIVVGGTGLYLRAALADLDLSPPPSAGARERWEAELQRRGPGSLHGDLARRAPWAAERVDPGDRRRLVRTLELLDSGELRPRGNESQLWTAEVRHPTLLAGLVMDRPVLHSRLDASVEARVAAGAREQVLRAHARGVSATARQAIGFDELLAGDMEAMKRGTRRYAKRQLTWMRKLAGVRLIDVTGRPPDDVAGEIDALAATP
ncbi:MAG: tRNA (adenosine(37)-N6)-dimethylallyltransferase MiaA [Solirubrobacteraceae bacterium]